MIEVGENYYFLTLRLQVRLQVEVAQVVLSLIVSLIHFRSPYSAEYFNTTHGTVEGRYRQQNTEKRKLKHVRKWADLCACGRRAQSVMG